MASGDVNSLAQATTTSPTSTSVSRSLMLEEAAAARPEMQSGSF